jgi:2-polyprenyl-3-methyl-5-hydroxy-6-metoxy-1,4-benzoquinol methylase
MKKWYEQLFSNYAKKYEKESYTQGTLQEVDFLEKEIRYNRRIKILDVGCGTGRHAIELAKRGYCVTGIDLSKNQLEYAREKACHAGVKVAFLNKDARSFSFKIKFDLVIMLCEGGFSLMETDEENFAILRNCRQVLKKNGTFIFTTLNALFPLNHSVKEFLNKNQASGPITKLTFDWITLREHLALKLKDDDGKLMNLRCNERYYMPSEISWLLKSIGFKGIEIFGCETGKFSRKQKLNPGNFEMLVVAKL